MKYEEVKILWVIPVGNNQVRGLISVIIVEKPLLLMIIQINYPLVQVVKNVIIVDYRVFLKHY